MEIITKPDHIHVAARKRVARQVKALFKMLQESCCGNNIHTTIDSFDDPPERSILILHPTIQET